MPHGDNCRKWGTSQSKREPPLLQTCLSNGGDPSCDLRKHEKVCPVYPLETRQGRILKPSFFIKVPRDIPSSGVRSHSRGYPRVCPDVTITNSTILILNTHFSSLQRTAGKSPRPETKPARISHSPGSNIARISDQSYDSSGDAPCHLAHESHPQRPGGAARVLRVSGFGYRV